MIRPVWREGSVLLQKTHLAVNGRISRLRRDFLRAVFASRLFTSLFEQPLVEFLVVVGFAPGVMSDSFVDGEADIPFGDFERVDHRL